ncbi:hypothetical protein [Ramlibacter alkalitolerans]|nr:hypothetical protein [Ramlibacter alkalitolerans]
MKSLLLPLALCAALAGCAVAVPGPPYAYPYGGYPYAYGPSGYDAFWFSGSFLCCGERRDHAHGVHHHGQRGAVGRGGRMYGGRR